MKEITTEGAERLTNAIIQRAVQDWRNARRRLRRNPKNELVLGIITDCETFFLSGWFSALTDLDGRLFLEKLKEEMALEERRLKHAKEREENRYENA